MEYIGAQPGGSSCLTGIFSAPELRIDAGVAPLYDVFSACKQPVLLLHRDMALQIELAPY